MSTMVSVFDNGDSVTVKLGDCSSSDISLLLNGIRAITVQTGFPRYKVAAALRSCARDLER